MSELVLIVEDDPAQRRVLEEMIRRFGFETLSADGGQAAIDCLNGPCGKNVELVVLDLLMPDVDGLAVLAHLSAARMEIPVIVQTAQGSIETVVRAMRAEKPEGRAEQFEKIIETAHASMVLDAIRGIMLHRERRTGEESTTSGAISRP